jgi:transcriptional regulator with XRE-family HTH domain
MLADNNTTQTQPDNANIGWRIKQLRLSRGLQQRALARQASIDPSYLSRLERGVIQKARPKPQTIKRILDALGATPDERASVYHVEEAPMPAEEIEYWVKWVAEHEEDSPYPTSLFDDRWFRCYLNRSARAAFGLTIEEYRQVIGEHLLDSLISPTSILYTRLSEELRRRMFASLSVAFKLHFARQQFDRWYLEVVDKIQRVPWAAQIWNNPPEDLSERMDRHELIVDNPIVGRLSFIVQFNRLLRSPRLFIVDWTPTDEQTRQGLAELVRRPEFSYRVPDDL